MTFEIVTKAAGAVLEPNQISIGGSGFGFGTKAMELFGENNFVEVYLDTTKRKVGFKSTNSGITGFKLRKGIRAGQIASNLTVKRLDKGTYEFREEEGFVVINVPRILKKGQEVVKQDD